MTNTMKSDLERKAYNAWLDMRKRCRNPNNKSFHYYGGRGISVCKEWDSFAVFVRDIGLPKIGQSLDRINNDGDYCKENCRWSDAKQQQRNTRKCKYITHNGETKTYAEWAEILGVTRTCIRLRIIAGWSVEDTLIEAKRQAVPEGWQLVPKSPTPAMVQDGRAQYYHTPESHWKAMLASAPQPDRGSNE